MARCELMVASWALSYGAEHLSLRYGAKFVGRTILSIATTVPEIAIVVYASAGGLYGIAVGAGLGSNIIMMTLGLSLMTIISTTLLRSPLKAIDVSTFRMDKIFLLVTALIGAILFVDGYNYLDGFVFVGMFIAYLMIALREMNRQKESIVL